MARGIREVNIVLDLGRSFRQCRGFFACEVGGELLRRQPVRDAFRVACGEYGCEGPLFVADGDRMFDDWACADLLFEWNRGDALAAAVMVSLLKCMGWNGRPSCATCYNRHQSAMPLMVQLCHRFMDDWRKRRLYVRFLERIAWY